MMFRFWLLCTLFVALHVQAESPIRPGDRVALVGNTFADQLRIHGYLETLLLQRSIENPISIRNLGWGGDMLTARDRPTNFPSEESTLREHKTDVIIACFGMGESFAGDAGLEEFRQDLLDFIASHKGKKYNGTSEVRLLLVSPISYEQLGFRTPNHERRNRELAAYTAVMRETADATSIPFVDLNEPTTRWMMDPRGPDLTTNGIHLSPYGYWCISRTLADALIAGDTPWRLELDARTGKATSTGVSIDNVQTGDDSLAFQVEELSWPSAGAPVNSRVHTDLESTFDIMRVQNLKPGAYRLEVDGQPIAVASQEAWSSGVVLDDTPAHQALKAYRDAVNDKNQQFVYSWKALNQVHIVGERRSSASGKALPGEIIEFNKLALERQKDLAKGIQLQTREWRLVPVKDFQ